MIISLESTIKSMFKATIAVVFMLMAVGVHARPTAKETIKTAIFMQQVATVEGTVFDAEGLPLPAVTVIFKSGTTTYAATTDLEGRYKVKVIKTPDAKLLFSVLGFKTAEVAINGRSQIDVKMQESTASIDEVVVIGYGTQKRGEVSSAISEVKGADISNNIGANTSFDRGLTGLVKGVQITQGSGEPGTGVDINIRGVTSPFGGGNNNPLFVIDGVPLQTNAPGGDDANLNLNRPANPLEGINPNDIESISILKDASATAIYGSRGANGVIIVNTKKSKKDTKATITFRSNSTFSEPINTPNYLNTAQYKARAAKILRNTADFGNKNSVYRSMNPVTGFNFAADFTTSGANTTFDKLRSDWFKDGDTDWVKEVYRNQAFTQQYYLNLNGGSRSTIYSFNAAHTDQEGLLKKDTYKLYSFRMNLDTDLNRSIKTGFSANISYSNNKTGYNNENSDLNSTFLAARPDIKPYDDKGEFNRLPGKFNSIFDTQDASPLARALGHDFSRRTFSMTTSSYVEVKIPKVKGLKIKGDVNIARYIVDQYDFTPSSIVQNNNPTIGQTASPTNSTLSVRNTINNNINANLLLSYNKTFANVHNISATAGSSMDRQNFDRTYNLYRNFPDDDSLTNESSAAETVEKAQNILETGLNSVFARVNYNYDQKYSLNLNFRADASSKFGPNNKWGYFPSASVGWNLSKESFLENVKLVDNLNLRGGYGRTGSNNTSDFAYIQFWRVANGADGLYAERPAVGINGTLPNLDIKWELSDELNVGLDYALWDNRIRGTIDYYHKKTTGALMAGYYPLESGADTYTDNFADLTNKGYELDINVDIIRNKDWRWSFGFNVASNTNTLDKFSSDNVPSAISRFFQVGKETNLIIGYVAEGFFQNQKEIDDLNAKAPDNFYQDQTTAPGDYKYKDLDGDGEITSKDQEYLGSSQADFFGGFNTEVTYKGFRLYANFSYSVGREATTERDDDLGITQNPLQNVHQRYLDTWSPDNRNAKYPRAVFNLAEGSSNNARTSSALVYDASYLRLQSLQFSYNLPKSITRKFGINDLTLSLTGTNLLTWTKFPGIDPTAVLPAASPGSTDSRSPYPIAKTWSLGFNINF